MLVTISKKKSNKKAFYNILTTIKQKEDLKKEQIFRFSLGNVL